MSVQRNFGLDLARALAITMVFLSHGITLLAPLGVGVDLFFLLSGFLIGRIYLRGNAEPHAFRLWGFWQARWFRTLPPYLAALALYAAAQPFFHNNAVHPDYLLFLQNYLGMDGFGPSWSLAVEEHFYLALPLIGWLALRCVGRRSLAWLLPLLALVPQILRIVAIICGGLPSNWYWRTHFHCEGLILGVWLACLFVDRPELWQRLRVAAEVLAVLPIALLIYQFRTPEQPAAFRAVVFLLYAIGYAGWLRLAYDLRFDPTHFGGRLLKRTVQGLALASYSIYLVHTLLLTDLRVLLDGMARGPAKSALILLGTLVFAIAFYFAIERPTILLRDRLMARRGARPEANKVQAPA
jgi:peptidoglycan/LPS O-acetylase OafA/YrhL